MNALKNRKALEESASAGCYQCLAVIPTQDVADWTDWGQTGLCPMCGCDCLIADSHGVPLDEEHLKKIHDYWLGK